MAASVVLNAVSILLVMGLSILLNLGVIVSQPSNPGVLTTVIHAAVGGIAEVLGIYLVWAWRFATSFASCARRRHLMRVTVTLWLTATLSGFVFYACYYLR